MHITIPILSTISVIVLKQWWHKISKIPESSANAMTVITMNPLEACYIEETLASSIDKEIDRNYTGN